MISKNVDTFLIKVARDWKMCLVEKKIYSRMSSSRNIKFIHNKYYSTEWDKIFLEKILMLQSHNISFTEEKLN